MSKGEAADAVVVQFQIYGRVSGESYGSCGHLGDWIRHANLIPVYPYTWNERMNKLTWEYTIL